MRKKNGRVTGGKQKNRGSGRGNDGGRKKKSVYYRHILAERMAGNGKGYIGVWKMANDRRDIWIDIIEKKYGIKISNLKYAAKDHYIAYAYGVDGEIVGLWNKEEGIPYGRVDVRLLNEKKEMKEILGEI